MIPVSDSSHVGEVRRRINQLASDAHLPPADCGNAAIVATELATNLVTLRDRWGDDPRLCYGRRAQRQAGSSCSRSIAAPALPTWHAVWRMDIQRAEAGGRDWELCAGFRPSGMSSLYPPPSRRSAGSVIFSRVTDKSKPLPKTAFTWGAVSRPAPHEVRCGDGWRIAERPGEFTLMMVDGLGHGEAAAAAADEAGDVFDADPFAPLPTMLQNAGVRLQKTRGGAMAAVRIDARNTAL